MSSMNWSKASGMKMSPKTTKTEAHAVGAPLARRATKPAP
jgi:hypothetical protein